MQMTLEQQLAALEIIRCEMQALGWARAEDLTVIGTITVEGYDRRHDGYAYVSWGTERESNFGLYGDFQSEGRNVLSPIVTLVRKAATAEEIRSNVKRFVEAADQAIGASYSVSLFRKWGKNPLLERRSLAAG